MIHTFILKDGTEWSVSEEDIKNGSAKFPIPKLWTKEVRSAYGVGWRFKNKERLTEKAKEYYIKNKDRINQRQKEYYSNNTDKVKDAHKRYYTENKEYLVKKSIEYKIKNKEKRAEYIRRYEEENKERIKIRQKDYRLRPEVRERRREAERERLKTNELFRLKKRIKCNIWFGLTRIRKRKTKKTEEIIGCSMEFLKRHIESQFLPGMSWENRSEWHIDHIVPQATAKTEDDIYRLNHYTNLRPLWKLDNLKKGANLNYELPNIYKRVA